jgi:hypothetical protein
MTAPTETMRQLGMLRHALGLRGALEKLFGPEPWKVWGNDANVDRAEWERRIADLREQGKGP